MTTPYAGSNITGTTGLIAVDKVGNRIRFYDPESLREIKSFPAPEPAAHELAISHDRRLAFVPLYGDGIYGNNKRPNNKILVIDLVAQALADVIALGEMWAPHGMVAGSDGKLWVVCDIPNKLLRIDPRRRSIEAAWDCPAKGAHQMAMLPDESKLYVSAKEGDLAAFDLARGAFTARVSAARARRRIGNGSGSEGLMPTADGRRLIVDRQCRQRPARHRYGDRHGGRPRAARTVSAVQSEALAPRQADVLARRPPSRGDGLCRRPRLGDRRRRPPPAVRRPRGQGPAGHGVPARRPLGRSWRATTAASSPASTSPPEQAVAAYDGGSGIEVLAYY